MSKEYEEIVKALNRQAKEIKSLQKDVLALREILRTEKMAEYMELDSILNPPTLYIPHPEWNFEYNNIIDVIEGRLNNLELEVFGLPEEPDPKEQEFNF